MSVEGELQRLDSSLGWFSRGKRKAALESLATDARLGNAEALIGLLERRGQPALQAAIAEILLSLEPELVARVWWQTRHPALAEWVTRDRLLAAEPTAALMTTALKSDRLEEVLNGNARRETLAIPLLDCAQDSDREVRERASRALAGDLPPELERALLQAAMEADCPPVRRDLVTARGRLPDDPALRVAFLVLTGRGEEAEQIDPEGELLRQAASGLSSAQRSLVLESLRQRGRAQLVTTVLGLSRTGPDLMTIDFAWSELLPEMLAQGRLEELWKLALHLHLDRSRQILKSLAERDFQPSDSDRSAYFKAIELARQERPAPHPLGRFAETVEWAEDRLFVLEDGQLVCLSWPGQDRLWSQPGRHYPLEQLTVSGDGLWAGAAYLGEFLLDHREGLYVLYDSQGESQWSEENQGVSFGFGFSPCSRWLYLFRSGRGENSSDYEEIWSLDPFQPVVPRRLASRRNEWCPTSGQILLLEDKGWVRVDLSTREVVPVELPTNLSSLSPDNTFWTIYDHAGQYFICHSGSSQPALDPMQSEFLPDGGLVLANFREAGLWDGARLFQRAQNREHNAFTLDARGKRLAVVRDDRTDLMRLSDAEYYRSFPGRFVRLHPTRPYLITDLDGEHCIWWAPYDLWLGQVSQAQLEELERGAGLEPGDRELALLLIQHRLRHEISLDGIQQSCAQDIEID